jgi:hypothetical protein
VTKDQEISALKKLVRDVMAYADGKVPDHAGASWSRQQGQLDRAKRASLAERASRLGMDRHD